MSESRFAILAASIRKLRTRLDSLRQADGTVTRYAQVAEATRRVHAQLDEPLRQWRALVDAGIQCDAEAGWTAGQSDVLARAIAPEALDLEDVGEAVELLKRETNSRRRPLLQAIQDAWTSEVKRALRRVPGPEQVLVLERLDPKRASRLREIRNELESLRDSAPTDADMCARPARLCAEAAQITEAMEDVPDEVAVFFRRVQSGFPLAELSDTILTWLGEHGLLEGYDVRPRSYQGPTGSTR